MTIKVSTNLDLPLVLCIGVIFLCLGCYLQFLWRKRDMFLKSWNVPGPLNLPVVGAAYLFMCRPEYIYQRCVKLQSRYPDGLKLWFGNQLVYFLHKPTHIEKILASPKFVQKDINYKHIIDAIGEGLLQAPIQIWRKNRKSIVPSFNQKILDSFVEVFAQQSKILTDVLANQIGKDIDIFEVLSRCTLDILCETAMGLQLNIQETNGDQAIVFDKIMKLVFLKIFQIWNHVDFIWRLIGYDKMLKTHLKKFNDLTDKVIKEKIEALEARKKRKPSYIVVGDNITKKPRLAFLDYIMEHGNFTALELRNEVNIFLFAGTDTTASTLSFVFAILGMFPEVQQKVYEEVIQIMGEDRMPESTDLPQMTYTERVIKETLRLFPVGAFFLRAITEDVDVGDYIIPKGSSAFFGTVFIHRNPKYWPNPLKFDPDRFLPEEIAKRHPCSYIAFSYGPRNCIGRIYGMMNMKVIIASVIRKFHIHCGYKKIEDVKLKTNIVLRFAEGAKLSVTPREHE